MATSENHQDEKFLKFVKDIIGEESFQHLIKKEEKGEDVATSLFEMFVILYTWNDLDVEDRMIAWDAARAMINILRADEPPQEEISLCRNRKEEKGRKRCHI